MNPIAVYPGSFDPITNGHVDIVRRSLQVFDQVIVAVAFNAQKDSAWFTPEERTDMIRDTFRGDGKRVVADAFSTLLVDYVSSKASGAGRSSAPNSATPAASSPACGTPVARPMKTVEIVGPRGSRVGSE